MNSNPIVSIVCITYNHELYIRQCLDGFIIQKTTFPIEILVNDDCSTDNTAAIVKEYEVKYPDLFRCVYQKENQYSKGVFPWCDILFPMACGKYIAFCEGDDYWTDPLKLQKQVDFLETNSEYSVCFHRYHIFNELKNIHRPDNCGFLFNDKAITIADIDVELFLRQWVTQPVTMVFRNNILDYKLLSTYKYSRDQHLIYHLLIFGKAAVLNFEGAVYRENANGIHGGKSLKFQVDIGIKVAQELYECNGTKALKDSYLRTLDWGIDCSKKNEWGIFVLYTYILKRFLVSRNIKKALKQLLK